MRPSQVLDAQYDLVTRLEEDLFRESIASTIVSELWGMDSVAHLDHDDRMRTIQAVANHFSKKLAWAATEAYCYRVSAEMCDVVEQSADALDESDEWHHALAPSSAGFVAFEKPIILGDFITDEGKSVEAVKIHYLIWGPGKPEGEMEKVAEEGYRTALYWMTDMSRVHDDPLMRWFDQMGHLDTVRRVQGRWLMMGWDSCLDGRNLGPTRVPVAGTGGGPGVRVALNLGSEILNAEAPGTQRNDMRIAHALWLLFQQTIVKLQPEVIERASRRRAARKHLPGSVTTIMLRRAEYVGERRETEGGREYLHQWVVRWHWRWQPYGSRQAKARHKAHVGPPLPGEHMVSDPFVVDGQVVRVCEVPGCDYYVKRIIIDSYIKGPEGKPLINPTKIMLLER